MKIPGIENKNITYTLIDYDHVQELISDGLSEDLIKIISKIDSIYPFTFLEKESVRKIIDKLDNFIWIKNRYGFCELVNQKLIEYLDTSFAQVEGNHEEMFFPVEGRRIAKTFNDVVSVTKKAVRVNGLSLVDKDQELKFDLINIPIVDAEETVIAIICLSIDPEEEKPGKTVENYSFQSQFLARFRYPAGIISKSGFFKKTNIEFQRLVALSEHKLENSLINKVFTSKYVDVINGFIFSKEFELVVESSDILQKQNEILKLTLGKIFDNKNNVIAIILMFDKNQEKLSADNQYTYNMIENLIKNNPDAVLICDHENLKFLEVNESAVNLYGYSRDEFLKMDLTDLYFTEDIQLLLDSSSANLREGSFHGPYKHKKKDGSVILVEMSRYSVKFQDREAHFNLVRNVTDSLEIEKRNQSFKSAFENTDDLILITDASGLIKYINKSVTNTLGYTKNDVLNSSFITIVSDEKRADVNSLIFHAGKKDSSTQILNLKTIDGRLLLVDMFVSPILDFNKEIGSFTIIGKVKPVAPASADDNKSNQNYSQSIKSSEEKIDSKFLASLFHELLTPVNVILGFAQELPENLRKSTAEQKEASQIIKQNRIKLLQSMNSAIEYASLSEKDINFLPAETKITDVLDLLLKDVDELKGILDVEFAYGKISSSLKFETDKQKFKLFLLLLFKIVTKLSDQKKIYFSAYAQDKEKFIISFRDLQTHCSTLLVTELNSLFHSHGINSSKELEASQITLLLTQKLLKILKGKFVYISDEKDRNDYGFVFPINYGDMFAEEIDESEKINIAEKISEKSVQESISEKQADIKAVESQQEPDNKTKTKSIDERKLAAKLQNELRIEALRENIRKKEEKQKSKKQKTDDDTEIVHNSNEDELIEDDIEYFDLDLHGNYDDQIEEEEIEIIETSAPKEKVPQNPIVQQTGEKVNISNLSCLYIEDQVDSQVLFSVQMKGLKNLNFSVSFEECLPLLESGNYDFIVIDINLQGSYNGLDILRIIRTMPRYENTPIFAATAYVLPGDQQKFVLVGFNGFIAKPIFRDEMIDLLAEVFKEPEQS